MIEIFQGRIGGGKTYNAVLRMAGHMRKGGHVFTNIEVNWEGFKILCEKSFGFIAQDEQFHVLTTEQIPSVHKHIASGSQGCAALVVVDEAQLFYNSRDWQKQDKGLLTFLTQSRKVCVDMIFITQAATNIDKQFRVLCQYVWAFKDMKRFIDFLPFDLIMCLQFDIDGRTLLKWYFIRKSKLVFNAYNTNALLKPIDFGGETLRAVAVERVKMFRKKPKMETPLVESRIPWAYAVPVILLTLLTAKIVLCLNGFSF
jgi:Zonular occludens toxin (Zot).